MRLSGCIILLGVLMTILAVSCPQGRPAIDRFFVLYDIVAVADSVQGVEWDVANASSVSLSLQQENGQEVWAKTVPSGTSNGVHDVPVASLDPGSYELVLSASNSQGSASDKREFLVVGREGLWFSFYKLVGRPQEGPWLGFADALIPVGFIQGAKNHEEVISVSEQVRFRKIRWKPDPFRWADREGCTSEGLDIMTIRQLTSNYTWDRGVDNIFPSEWSITGQYYCTVWWTPCNFGWDGDEKTISNVGFSLELEAIGF